MTLRHAILADKQVQEDLVQIDQRLSKLDQGPSILTGARDDPEAALKNLISLLASKGLLSDQTSAS